MLAGCQPQLSESTAIYDQKARPCSRALPGQPSSLLLPPRNKMLCLPWLTLTLLHKKALPKGVSTSSFSPRFALPGQPGTTVCGREAVLAYRASLRDLFCCLLFYREQNSVKEAGLLSVKPIPPRMSNAILAGQVIFCIFYIFESIVQREKIKH